MYKWPVGLMDKASASGAGDSRFESWAGHFTYERQAMLAPRNCNPPCCPLLSMSSTREYRQIDRCVKDNLTGHEATEAHVV